MPTCPSCGRPVSGEARFCPACGTPLDRVDAVTGVDFSDDATAAGTFAPKNLPISNPRPPSRPRTPPSHPSHPAWLSTPDVSHGRFPPGTVLADRYRIVGRLGQGGMGEVYRADDLKLGQAVALKFLPPSLERDPVRLAQFHNEVRLARQIAHKNVCRMYDVGDADGLPFMTMEYVDGEDLASLLRRIGRLPGDKATELAQQLCAGVAAAHERGVLHRDLKPANVMIDGAGQVRVTDFGLAAIEGAADIGHAGTPAYMAPELLAGKEPSVQSDLFALGLVLYELFTGRRAYTAQSIRELIQQQNDTTITSPRSVVKDLDPAIDRAIMHTLERNPADRPRSAIAVAASLPGGDPLAAALAAGETPSPEIVAAAGARAAATRTHAVLAGAGVTTLLILCAALSLQQRTLRRMDMSKPPAVLADRAQQVLEGLGFLPGPPYTHWQFDVDGDLMHQLLEDPAALGGHDVVTSRPGPLRFLWRSSPRELIPYDQVGGVTPDDPPQQISGMTSVVLDLRGRLLKFSAVPPQVDETPVSTAPPDWSVPFRLAGLDLSTFTPATPKWLPSGNSDTRAAWTGALPEGPSQVRVEAAAWRGRPIYFELLMPWAHPNQMNERPPTVAARVLNAVEAVVTLLLLGTAVLLARRNVRAGRGDWTAAMRLGIIGVATELIAWVLGAPHMSAADVEVQRFFLAISESLFSAGALFVMYLAVEPAMRHYWPDSLLGSTRLLRGHVIDARVGRDLLIGITVGASIILVIWARDPLQFALGAHYPALSVGDAGMFSGVNRVLGMLSQRIGFSSWFASMWCVLGLAGLKRLLKHRWLVGITGTVLLTLLLGRNLFISTEGIPWVNLATALLVLGIIVAVAVQRGLLAAAATLLTTNAFSAVPWTLNPGAWFFAQSAVPLVVFGGLVAAAAYGMASGASEAGR